MQLWQRTILLLRSFGDYSKQSMRALIWGLWEVVNSVVCPRSCKVRIRNAEMWGKNYVAPNAHSRIVGAIRCDILCVSWTLGQQNRYRAGIRLHKESDICRYKYGISVFVRRSIRRFCVLQESSCLAYNVYENQHYICLDGLGLYVRACPYQRQIQV